MTVDVFPQQRIEFTVVLWVTDNVLLILRHCWNKTIGKAEVKYQPLTTYVIMSKQNHPIKKRKPFLLRTTRIMILAVFFQVILLFTAAAAPFTITLSARNETLEGVLKKIQRQTGWCFLYTQEALSRSKRLSVVFTNIPLEDALRRCFKDQPLTYTIVNKVIVVKEKK